MDGEVSYFYRHLNRGKRIVQLDLKSAAGRDALFGQLREADALIRVQLEQLFASQPLDHWRAVFSREDCCVTPVLRLDEALVHPVTAASGSPVRIVG